MKSLLESIVSMPSVLMTRSGLLSIWIVALAR